MKTPTKKAAAPTAAKENKQQYEAYRKTIRLSSLKQKIGQLLFSLAMGTANGQGWPMFERLLREYYKGAGR